MHQNTKSNSAFVEGGEYVLIQADSDGNLPGWHHDTGEFDRPLPCCGCGIGWFSFLLGFLLPFLWYYGTFLYFFSQYQKDPRERAGCAACAIAALVFTLGILILVLVLLI